MDKATWQCPIRMFGVSFRSWRRGLGITQEELAKKISWDATKISRIESGRQLPNSDEIKTLVEGIGGSGIQVMFNRETIPDSIEYETMFNVKK